MTYIDLTHTFTDNMPVFPGDEPATLKQISDCHTDDCNKFEIKSSMHVGTHIDAPLHMKENGSYISDIPVETFFGRGILIDARGKTEITADLLENIDIQKNDIVIVMTGFYEKFGTEEYFAKYPDISEEFAKKIVQKEVKILGLDTPSPDKKPFKIHKILFAKNILIIENLTNLKKLLGIPNFEIIALPSKFMADASFVRVIANAI